MKLCVLLALFGVAIVAAAETYQALDISERGFGPLRDGSVTLNGDTPVRQAQRERRAERSPADEQAAVSLMETDSSSARYRGANGPALNRLTGAAKTFHPNDQMCVMCQFLVQRTQLDMAHFNVLGGFTGIKAKGANGAANAAAGGGDAGAKAATEEGSFLEIGTEFATDDASADWAAEDAEEAAAMEIAAKEELAESDGDWNAVAALEEKAHAIDTVVEEIDAEDGDEDEDESEDEDEEQEGDEFEEEDSASDAESEAAVASKLAAASFSETSATVLTEGLTAQEQREMAEVAAEMRDDKIASSVAQQLEDGMSSGTVMMETAATAAVASDSDEEMNADEVEVAPESLANSQNDEFENALGESFDNQLTLDTDEEADLVASMQGKNADADAQEESDWSSPAYNADGVAAAMDDSLEITTAIDADHEDEDMALLQVDATEQDEVDEAVQADAELDEELEGAAENVQLIETAANPQAVRAYARVMHNAEHAPIEPVLAEVSGQHAQFQSAGGLARVATRDCRRKVQRIKRCQRIEPTKRKCKIIRRKAPRPAGCGARGTLGIANSPRRFRLADALHSRPRWNRWDPTVKPHPDANRAKAREMWHHLMQMTYDRLEGYCSTRLPEQFTPFCRPLLRRFRVVAEGIRYGDRPNQICMRTRFCPRGSYVRRSPHNVFKHIKTSTSNVVYRG